MSETLQSLSDRIAIRAIVDDYAFYADLCDVQAQVDLFSKDTVYIVEYLDNPEATQTFTGKESLVPLFEQLTHFHTKTHFNGQNKVFDLTETTAKGIAYCLAHHITITDGKQSNMVASIRYDDEYIKEDGNWLFSRRHLKINWVENRS